MATVTLIPLTYATSPTYFGVVISTLNFGTNPQGSADDAECLRIASDSKFEQAAAGAEAGLYLFMDDGGLLPANANITSISFTARHRTTVGFHAILSLAGEDLFNPIDTGGVFVTETSAAFTNNVPGWVPPILRSQLLPDSLVDASQGLISSLLLQPSNVACTYDLDYFAINVTYGDASNPQIRRYDGHTDRVYAHFPTAP